MILIGIKNISATPLYEIKEKAQAKDAFYRDYILSPVKEKDGEIQRKHAAAREANVAFLEEFCKQKFSKLPIFSAKENGKPCFSGEDGEILFSFSHSEDLAVCAVFYDGLEKEEKRKAFDGKRVYNLDEYDGELVIAFDAFSNISALGVDVQKAKNEDLPLSYHHEKIGERFFLPDDYAFLIAEPNEDNFYRLWTKTESLAKMTGEGIARYKKHGKDQAKTETLTITSKGEVYYLSVSVVDGKGSLARNE